MDYHKKQELDSLIENSQEDINKIWEALKDKSVFLSKHILKMILKKIEERSTVC